MEMMMLSEKTEQQSTLPDDVIMECIAPRVSRCNHPTLSLVSKQFRSLVASRELYARRSFLGCTEQRAYVLITYVEVGYAFWYSLNRITNSNMVENRLVPILSLPCMPICGDYFAVGSKIFVMGGCYGNHNDSTTVFCIDCQTHTARRGPDMPFVVIETTISKVIGHKIYITGRPVVVGDFINRRPKIVMVFDTRTETWEPQTKSYSEVDPRWFIGKPIDYPSWTIYHDIPKEVKLGTNESINYLMWRNECVMDDVLYEYDGKEHVLRTCDLKQRIWGVVKGMEKLPLGGGTSHMVSCGKKLVLFLASSSDFDGKREIWCAEVTVEKRQGGEIWGNIECCHLFLDGCFDISKCLLVTL